MVDECERLAARFVELEAKGLVDVRFLFQNTDDYTREMMCSDAYELLDAYLNGEGVELEVPQFDTK